MKQMLHGLLLVVTLPLLVEVVRMWFAAADQAGLTGTWKVLWLFDAYSGYEPLIDGIFYPLVVPTVWVLNVMYWWGR